MMRKLTLLMASMMTMMAGAVVSPALPQINKIFSLTPNADILTRLIITLPAFFIAIFSPSIGKLSDIIGRKKILLISLILYSISGASGFFLNNLYSILIGRAFLGISVAGIMTMVGALVGDYYKGYERSSYMGQQGVFMGFGGVFFIAFSGWLTDFGWHIPFLIYLFGFIVLPMAIIYIYEIENFKAKKRINYKNVKYQKKLFAIIYVLIFFSTVAFYMIPVQIPYVLKPIEGITNTHIGIAIAIQSLSGAFFVMNYKRIKSKLSFFSIYQLIFSLLAIGYILISFGSTYNQYLVGLIIAGMGVGLLMPTGTMWTIEIAPESIRGKLVGRANTAMFLAMFLSPIIVQPIINISSILNSFLVMGIFLLIIVISIQYIKKYKLYE
jgi:MFS family permease